MPATAGSSAEHFRILKAAWTDDLLQYKGEHYEVPYPYDEGIQNWPPADFTRQYGTPGEIDENGTVVGVSVVPRPFQQPHPPVFQANSTSAKTVDWAAREGVIPTMLATPDETVFRLARGYREVAASVGHELAPGEQTGIVRSVQICRDRSQLDEMTSTTTARSGPTGTATSAFSRPCATPARPDRSLARVRPWAGGC